MSDSMSPKHAAFLRLMQKRLDSAHNVLRLIEQLSSKNYENTQIEAEEVVKHLDSKIHMIADAFSVPYATAIGDAVSEVKRTGFGPNKAADGFSMSEYDVIKAVQLIQEGNSQDAASLLKSALKAEAR